MDRFAKIRKAYAEFDSALKAARISAEKLLIRIENELFEYIGCPKTYKSSGTDTECRYIHYIKIEEEPDSEDHFQFESSEEHPARALNVDSEGHWLAAVVVTVDRNENSYPKHKFAFPFSFEFEGSNLMFYLRWRYNGDNIEVDEDDLSPLYREIYAGLLEYLDYKKRSAPRRRLAMGFTSGSSA